MKYVFILVSEDIVNIHGHNMRAGLIYWKEK